MSKIVVFNSLTLDGVMQAPGRPDEDTRDEFGYGGWGGGVGWSQANTLAALDRSRYLGECMRLRGYTQQPIRSP